MHIQFTQDYNHRFKSGAISLYKAMGGVNHDGIYTDVKKEVGEAAIEKGVAKQVKKTVLKSKVGVKGNNANATITINDSQVAGTNNDVDVGAELRVSGNTKARK